MTRQYYNRYQLFDNGGEHKIVPGVTLPIKSSDSYFIFKKNKDRLDKLSQEYYGSPLYGWLILLANPNAGSIEFEIPDNFVLRIPFPLINSLQDYKRAVEIYNLYYGE
jgi:hypothetical protein